MKAETWVAPARCRECGSYPELLRKGSKYYKYRCPVCKIDTPWYVDGTRGARQVWNLMQGVIDA